MTSDARATATVAAAETFRLRVYYEDTDAGGIVYHASYLRFAERARTEWLRALGTDHRTLMEEHGILFAVRRLEIDYLAPARLDDGLAVETGLVALGGTSLRLDQRITRGGTDIARLGVQLVAIGRDGRPARLPDHLRAAFSRLASTKETQGRNGTIGR